MTIPITDYITILAILYLFYRGWKKGLLKTLLGPLSLVAGCAAAFFYYQKTENLLTTFAICFFGPFVIAISISLMLKLWHKTVNDNAETSKVSRVFGGTVSTLWGGCYLAIMLLMIGMIPLKLAWFEKIQTDVTSSYSYTFLKRVTGKQASKSSFDLQKFTDILEDPKKLEKYQSTEEFQAMADDEALNALLEDEEVIELIRNQEYTQLLSNPKVRAVFQNEDTLKKLLKLNEKIMEGDVSPSTGTTVPEAMPRVIEIK